MDSEVDSFNETEKASKQTVCKKIQPPTPRGLGINISRCHLGEKCEKGKRQREKMHDKKEESGNKKEKKVKCKMGKIICK
jgi:hypothetical protein